MSKRLKAQRTRLVQRIEETLVNGQELLSTPVVPEEADAVREPVGSLITLLGCFQERFEGLSERISEVDGDDGDTVEEGEETMDMVLQMTEMSVKLSSRLNTVDRHLEASSKESKTSDAIETQLTKLVELEIAKSSRQGSSDGFINLPKLDFVTFRGDVLKWNEFWDSFAAAVDKNPSLQPVQKLAYLLSKLRDEAKAVVAGFQTTNENYPIVVDLLRQSFGNQQAAITAHYSKIMELPASPNQTNRLRSLHDELEQHLRCLSSLGEDTEHRHFISLIMTKLPKTVIIKLEEMKDPTEAWTVQLLRQRLQNHLVARETADRQGATATHYETTNRSTGSSGHQNVEKSRRFKDNGSYATTTDNRSQKFSTAEMLYASEKEKASKSPLCIFCKQKHWSDECKKHTTVFERKKLIKGRCFNCLGKDHSVRTCTSTKPCFHCKRTKNHHSALCPQKFGNDKESTHVVVDKSDEDSADESLLATGERALLQTALVEAVSPGSEKRLKVRLLFDSGSHRSYISEEIVQKLRLKSTGTETISINTFGARKSKSVKTNIVDFGLLMQDGSSTTVVGNVVPRISASFRRHPINLKKYSKILSKLKLADEFPIKIEDAKIDVLIGSDYYMDLINFEKKSIGDGLHLLGSKFGWILTGRIAKTHKAHEEHSMLILNATNQNVPNLHFVQPPDICCPIDPNPEDFWSLEAIGINDSKIEVSDEEAVEKFNNSVQYEDGRYFVQWPWREEPSTLPPNYQLAVGRLNTLIRKLRQNPELFEKYSKIIEDQIAKGVVEKAPESHEGSIVHYIPHQAVFTPQKNTTKVRIVYDASAKTRKDASSLNECLLRGPVILEDLCGLLMRFRMHKLGITADIEKAFLQIGLQERDRDVVRFVWLKDASKATTEDNLQNYRFCRVPFGVISSPFLLGATLVHHLGKNPSAISSHISSNLYVDNLITGVSSQVEANSFYLEAKSLFKEASMNLREWTSNCPEFINKIQKEDRCLDKRPKVLGMVWDVEKDDLAFSSVTYDADSQDVTKRVVFKKIARYFDPMGFVCPVTIRGKIFLQSLWSEGLKWDDKLNNSQREIWNEIATDLQAIKEINVPRFLQNAEISKKEDFALICFCDASAKAYACCIYLRFPDKNGNVGCELIFAKSRLAPVKRQTIPRLELLAVLIGVRALKFAEKHLRLEGCKKFLWSDSKCVLHWIETSKLQPIFVKNRLTEIRNHIDVSFKYVKTDENPADIPTRGISCKELKNCKFWWKGPAWIQKPICDWQDVKIGFLGDRGEPANHPAILYEASLLVGEENISSLYPFDINPSEYSSLNRLLRVSTYCQRFVDKLKKKAVKIKEHHLSSTEVQHSKLQWEKCVQHCHFFDVLKAMRTDKKHDLIGKFDLFIDNDGLLRCRGRLQNAELDDNARFPKLLPKNDRFTVLVVDDLHKTLHHAGVSQTLAQLRQEYWLPQGRNTVRKILSKCKVCKRWQGGPYKVPPMPSLPDSRVVQTIPFHQTAVDCFGPLYVKNNAPVTKVWACLFTCLTVRAVHLEILTDMSADEFLLSFRRFIARRGCPAYIYSDNGSNFVAARNVITSWNNIFEETDVLAYFATKGIHWKLIPQHAPWMGGFYERLVGVVKCSLKKAIGKVSLSLLQLQTFLNEVEAIVNSRPLTYVSEDIQSSSALTPNSFLTFNCKLSLTPDYANEGGEDDPDYLPAVSSCDRLLIAWKKGQIRLNDFWKIWHEQYLTSLRERTQRFIKQPHHLSHDVARLDDIVTVKENLPRGCWKLAGSPLSPRNPILTSCQSQIGF